MDLTAIIKPTHKCNLACRYCYVEESAEQGMMDSKTLEGIFQQLADLPKIEGIHIIWHGGEPLLMGLNFYEEAVSIQQRIKNGKRFRHGMQSNATLINDAFLDFFEKYGFDVGSSLDGPEEIHNLTRVYPDGRGSFQDVWKGLQLIRKRNEELRKIAKEGKPAKHLGGGTITILTRKNILELDKVYDFFKNNKVSMKINPLIKSGRAKQVYEELGIGPAEYGKSLVRLFDRWFYEKETGIDIDPLSDILGNLMTKKPTSCNFGESCRRSFISIGPNGDVYPCGRFDGVQEYWLGNTNKDKFLDILESRKHKMMAERSRISVRGCSNCDYGNICNAGCMHNAYMQRENINDKDYYCRSYRILFNHLEKALNVELKKVEVNLCK